MDKTVVKVWATLASASIFAGGIAWLSSAPWWVIAASAVGAPLLLVFFFFVIVANELAKNI